MIKKLGFLFKIDEDQKITCANCKHYKQEDEICSLKNIHIPSIGYGYWQYCDSFNYEKLVDDPYIAQNVDNIFHSLSFDNEFMKRLSDDPATKYLVKGRITELLYTGLKDETIDDEDYDDIDDDYDDSEWMEDPKKEERKYFEKHYEKYPDISKSKDLERYLKNIIVIALEKQIPLIKVFEPTKAFLKSIYLIRMTYDNPDLDMDKTFKMYDDLLSKLNPYYSLYFISNVKEILNCTYEEIFNMTDEERTKRLLNLLENEWEVDLLTRNHFFVKKSPKDFGAFQLYGKREFNKIKNKFEFSLMIETYPWYKFPAGVRDDFILYSETDNGPLIDLYLQGYEIEWDTDIYF